MLALFLGLCLSVAHCVPITDADEGSLTVNIDTGPIRGKRALNLSRKFLGIPFAAPPLGELRWKAPAAPASWTAVRDTTTLPKSCPQPKNGLAWGETQEDCLYLNVYAPRNTDKPVPVMVWFYGGSWEYGGTSLPLYDGADTAGRDDVVIVTVNYRLGVLGFLGSEALRAADGSTGNYGIQDQRSALEWVQRNIAVFGGDKTRVTIFGQSAGSGSVATHLLSPRSQGLFHRAIMQSGPVADWTSKNMSLATTNYNAVVDHVNCTRPHTADTLSCLRQANVSDLLSAHVVKFLVDWAPVIDGVDVVEEAQARAAAGNWSSKVPIMLGTVKDEGTTLMGGIDYDATVDDYKAWLQKKYAPYADELFQMYPPKSTDKGAAFYAASAVFTDDAMACPARRTARWISRVDAMPPAYLYHFMHTLALVSPDKKLGCFHGTEIAFVFEIFPMLLEVGEQRLGRDMADAWTRFAATGNPNPSSDALSSDWPKAGWPAYTQTGDNNFVFQTGLLSPELSVQSALKHANCDWWDQRPGQPL